MSEEFENSTAVTEETASNNQEEVICECPVCHKNIYERRDENGNLKGYICEDRNCFAMWKNNFFLKEHHITLDRGIAIALMSDERRIKLPDIYAPKTDTYFDGYLNLKIDGKKCRYSFSF